MNKLIYDTQSGELHAWTYAAQNIENIIILWPNSAYIEIDYVPDEQFLFNYKVNLTTLELELKT